MPVNAFLANTISSLSLGFRDILCLVLLNATIFAVCKKPGCMSFPHLGHFINECPLFNSNYLLLFYSVILNYSTTEREASIIMYYTQDQIDRANQAAPPKEQKAEPKKAKSAAKKRQRFRALTAVSLYRFLYGFISPRGIWAPFEEKVPQNRGQKKCRELTKM